MGVHEPARPQSAASVPEAAARDADQLFSVVYAELRSLAHGLLAGERPDHTLRTTALVHEAYLRLSARSWDFESRGQFFALAARAMRRILVDYARRHRARKRSPSGAHVSLSALDVTGSPFAVAEDAERAEFLLALDEALHELRTIEERLALVVEYRFFVGLTEPETAELLGVTARTVARDWVRARGWLYRWLADARLESGANRP